MNLENIILSELSPAQKGKDCVISHVASKIVIVIEAEHRMVVASSLGQQEMERLVKGIFKTNKILKT